MLRRRGVRVTELDPGALPTTLPACDLVIDAAYGTGFRGEYRAPAVPAGTPVLAIDIPSGLDADTGLACEGAVSATETVTMAALKPGLLMGDGPALAGRVEVAPIGIAVAPGKLWLVEDADIAGWLPAREPETNKWRSACVVVAGSPGMIGAARFSTSAAQRAGAGMVRWCVPGASPDELPASEAVALSVPATDFADAVLGELRRCRALVIGPGIGSEPGVVASVRRLVAEAEVPVIVDADGLGALGPLEDAREVLAGRKVASGAHAARRRVRAACRHGTGRGQPPGWRPCRGGPVPCPGPRRHRAPEGLDDSGRRARRPGLPRHVRIGSSCDGRDR